MLLIVFSLLAQAGAAQKPLIDLENRVKVLEAQIDFLQHAILNRTAPILTTLDCDGGKFSEIAPVGSSISFFAACEHIEPYLEGYKITLALGNPHAMPVRGLAGKLAYGEDATRPSAKTVAFSVVQPLTPGSWTRIVVAINPASAKDLRVVELREIEITGTAGGLK